MKKIRICLTAILLAISVFAGDLMSVYAFGDKTVSPAVIDSYDYNSLSWGPELTFDSGSLVAQTDEYFFFNDTEDGVLHARGKTVTDTHSEHIAMKTDLADSQGNHAAFSEKAGEAKRGAYDL